MSRLLHVDSNYTAPVAPARPQPHASIQSVGALKDTFDMLSMPRSSRRTRARCSPQRYLSYHACIYVDPYIWKVAQPVQSVSCIPRPYGMHGVQFGNVSSHPRPDCLGQISFRLNSAYYRHCQGTVGTPLCSLHPCFPPVRILLMR